MEGAVKGEIHSHPRSLRARRDPWLLIGAGLDELLGACELSSLPSLAVRVADLERLMVEAPHALEALWIN